MSKQESQNKEEVDFGTQFVKGFGLATDGVWEVWVTRKVTVMEEGERVEKEIEQLIPDACRVRFASKFGTFVLGRQPGEYDRVVFREIGGGGSVTLLYAVDPETAELWTGLVLESRSNMGPDPVLCIAGGFVKPGETHEQAGVREAKDETGLDTTGSKLLPGAGTNPNRQFFAALPEEGTHSYAYKVPWTDLALREDGTRGLTASLPKEINRGKTDNVVFMRWQDAALRTADSLARGAILQLLASR